MMSAPNRTPADFTPIEVNSAGTPAGTPAGAPASQAASATSAASSGSYPTKKPLAAAHTQASSSTSSPPTPTMGSAESTSGGGLSDQTLVNLTRRFARLPGLGMRSAQRIVFALIAQREQLLRPLLDALATADERLITCDTCGNIDVHQPCSICADFGRDRTVLCVVERMADLWALERSMHYHGLYHVLGGTLSSIDGVRPEDLRINALINRVETSLVSNPSTTSHAASFNPRAQESQALQTPPNPQATNFPTANFPADGADTTHHGIKEVILATNATLEGQITAQYIAQRLTPLGVKVNVLARGIPAGSELDYLDSHTLASALESRRPL